MNINITIFNPLLEYGGLEIATTKLGKELQDRTFNVDVVAFPNSRVEKLAETLDLKVKHIKMKQPYFNFHAAYNLSKIFNQSGTDISIVGKSSLLSTAILAKMLSRKKPIIVFHQQMQSGLNKKDLVHNWIFKNLDGAVVLNNRMKEDILKTTIIHSTKVRVIPYGIDIQKFKPIPEKKIELRKNFNLPTEDFLIGCIGRIDRQKGQDVLLNAFMELENKENIKLVFAGDSNDEEYFRELNNTITENKIEDKVIFLPFTDKVPELMNCFDIFVAPSHCETFGLVIIEGMACSLAVIGTDCGGVPEIIDSGKNGYIFEPKNSNDLSDLINMLYQNRDLLDKIGKKARYTVEQKFDRDIEINNIIKYYLELLSNKKT
ncbi:MAG: glycosyltransferase family 4 protein [Candidatus Kapabacteria bacterium]|nr:glycosyltransferase family 4 protein [Candidatus Kapabacteria bacterium]